MCRTLYWIRYMFAASFGAQTVTDRQQRAPRTPGQGRVPRKSLIGQPKGARSASWHANCCGFERDGACAGLDPVKTRAAVAWEAGGPLTIETVDLGGPKAGEVLVRLVAAGVCQADAFTLSGADPEGLFPAILGHEGGGVVEE